MQRGSGVEEPGGCWAGLLSRLKSSLAWSGIPRMFFAACASFRSGQCRVGPPPGRGELSFASLSHFWLVRIATSHPAACQHFLLMWMV